MVARHRRHSHAQPTTPSAARQSFPAVNSFALKTASPSARRAPPATPTPPSPAASPPWSPLLRSTPTVPDRLLLRAHCASPKRCLVPGTRYLKFLHLQLHVHLSCAGACARLYSSNACAEPPTRVRGAAEKGVDQMTEMAHIGLSATQSADVPGAKRSGSARQLSGVEAAAP